MATKKVLVKSTTDIEIPSTSDIVNMNTNVSIPTGSGLTANSVTSQAVNGLTINGLSSLTLQNNSTTFISTSSTAVTLQNLPLVVTPRICTTNATLNSYDRYVITRANGGSGLSITLPSAPPNGTIIELFNSMTSNQLTTVNRGGSDTILGIITSFDFSFYGKSIVLVYDSVGTTWNISNLTHLPISFTFTSALTNDYLQPAGTGGILSTAQGLFSTNIFVVIGDLRLRTRSAVAADTTLKIRSTSDFSTAADLTASLSTTIPNSSSSGNNWAKNVLTNSKTSSGPSWFVIQATTAITTTVYGVLDVFII